MAPTALRPSTAGVDARIKKRRGTPVASPGRPSTPSTPSTTPPSPWSDLPWELQDHILELAAYASTAGEDKVSLLLVSRRHSARLAGGVYHTVLLCSVHAVERFAALVRSDRGVARRVQRLWIGPSSTTSDLITALSPPSHPESTYVTTLRDSAHAATRAVLRACRRVRDVALAGELVSLSVAHTYGSACQPRRLTSVNPHSFVGGFSADIFRRVTTLRIVDTNLADDEVDEIRTLCDLEWLIWSSPKDYGDISRDTNVLRRLLSRPRRHLLPLGDGERSIGLGEIGGDGDGDPPTLPDLAALRISDPAIDVDPGSVAVRPSKNDHFRLLTISTASERQRAFRSALGASFPLVEPEYTLPSCPGRHDNNNVVDDDDDEYDRETGVPFIQPTSLDSLVVEEWDALRDLINQAHAGYGVGMLGQDEEGRVDPSNALARQRDWWLREEWV
ncbi:uncharacterized protein PFL1_06385 [Pseudozyma flocculosa PF-1]|uniref:Uncharacterized protein n=2 Tax=Pseudozyma flocculosa TaxID=84751 RepID=A0A5C3FAT6_9BASI|nr:uncharacterized protein PFL1_06385 [Pseudozyma flocculosa PF-1]EPQ26178.1 hypothetical protein PFL1_06385 [Pseudozyma flocculosa PF-1]SPO40429.1 uncharacterized protein PSFLO_05911 [Pseudozyma flocculosa]